MKAYSQNSWGDSKAKVSLVGIDQTNRKFNVQPDATLYNFSIIEKNRIEKFGHLTANSDRAQTEALSQLFGFETFSEFVEKFPDSLTDHLPDISELDSSIEELEQKIQHTKEQESALNSELEEIGNTRIEISDYINADPKSKVEDLLRTRSKSLQSERDRTAAQKTINVKASLPKIYTTLSDNFFEKLELEKLLQTKKQALNARALYEAALKVRAESEEHCPLCETDIKLTAKNPYLHANEQIQNLENLAELERQYEQMQIKERSAIEEIKSDCGSLLHAADRIGFEVGTLFSRIENALNDFSKNSSEEALKEIKQQIESSEYQQFEVALKDFNNICRDSEKIIESLEEEISEVESQRDKFIRLTGREAKVREEIGEKRIVQISLVRDLALKQQEKFQLEESIESIRQKLNSYATFIKKLKRFKEELPVSIAKSISEKALQYWNYILPPWQDFEFLDELILPNSPGGKIEIRFRSNPEIVHDAILTLNEGKIKALGLCLILAKNSIDLSPLLILDDPVNALDVEHQGGVRKLLFDHPDFVSKQIILTSHSAEFLKNIQQYSEATDVRKAKCLHLERISHREVILHEEQGVHHYLSKAEDLFSKGQLRESLSVCRRAAEAICQKIFNNLGENRINTLMVVQVSNIKQPPQFATIVDGLIQILKERTKDSVYNDLILLLENLRKLRSTLEWDYLNKGTHEEERAIDFDKDLVYTIIERLGKIQNENDRIKRLQKLQIAAGE